MEFWTAFCFALSLCWHSSRKKVCYPINLNKGEIAMIPDTLDGVLKAATTDVNNLLPAAVALIIAVACIPFAKRIVRKVFG